jgi:lysozyme
MTLPHIPSPEGTTNLIVDLSADQANANFAAAKADGGVVAVFLKATEGATYQDPAFLSLYDKVRAENLKIGAYHFGTARPAADQVENFINTVTRIAGSFHNIVPMLDLEHNDLSPDNTMSPDLGEAWVAEFVRRTGKTPVLYAGGYLRDLGGARNRPALAGCPLWVAAYTNNPAVLPGWADWTLWQFTGDGKGPHAGEVPGLGYCDQSIFRGDIDAFSAFWGNYA